MNSSSKKRYQILHDILLYSVIILYLFILFIFLFGKSSSLRSINLIPFQYVKDYIMSDYGFLLLPFLSNVIGNIVLFIPLGIYISLFRLNKKVLPNTLLIIFISILVETIQYIFKIGVTDIDDVILNGLGGFFGIIFYRLIYRVFEHRTRNIIEIIAPLGGGMIIFVVFILNI